METIAVRYIRGQTVESVHRAHVAVVDAKGSLVASFGNPRYVSFLRSCAKPFQVVPLVESGAVEAFRFSEQEIAVMAGSHGGEPAHVATVQGILDKIGLGPEKLLCGRHAPYHKQSAEVVGEAYSAIHHNCSGKHAGMLALAVHGGWDTGTYIDAAHPVQRAILKVVAQLSGLREESVATGIDGCGVLSFALPMKNGARAFARLADPDSVKGRRGATLRRIRDAMMAHPDMVAGTGRLDTDVMRRLPGKIVVKVGAEACHAVSLVERGLGVCLKVEDGSARALGPLVVRVLEGLGVLSNADKEALARHWKEPLRNVAGRPVGRVECTIELQRHEVRDVEVGVADVP